MLRMTRMHWPRASIAVMFAAALLTPTEFRISSGELGAFQIRMPPPKPSSSSRSSSRSSSSRPASRNRSPSTRLTRQRPENQEATAPTTISKPRRLKSIANSLSDWHEKFHPDPYLSPIMVRNPQSRSLRTHIPDDVNRDSVSMEIDYPESTGPSSSSSSSSSSSDYSIIALPAPAPYTNGYVAIATPRSPRSSRSSRSSVSSFDDSQPLPAVPGYGPIPESVLKPSYPPLPPTPED